MACGVRVEGSSGDGLQRPRLDDPQASPDDPRRRLDEHMGCAIEDYERAIAARKRCRSVYCKDKQTKQSDFDHSAPNMRLYEQSKAKLFRAFGAKYGLV